MLKTITNQFKRPYGFLGKIISMMMKKGNSKAIARIISELEINENDRLFEIGYGHFQTSNPRRKRFSSR